ncbi:MAG: PucC family protein, partial [Pseudomonadota bacterium]
MRPSADRLFGRPPHAPAEAGLNWFGIFRLGAVQLSLGAIVVLATSTLNRVMVVELALPAMLPGLLLGLHYAVQLSRPRWGYGSDAGGSRTAWIIGGMAVLALSIVGAAASTWAMPSQLWLGVAAAVFAYFMIGVGVGPAGTSPLPLMATTAAPRRRPA